MQIQLGTIIKRLNSTKNAPSSWTAVNGTLKGACDMLNPVIEINFGNSNPCGYNYMYIADFGRYYYVTWEFTGSAHWNARGSVDVLASAKTDIGNSPKYIMRAASESNEYLIDTLYPAECKSQEYAVAVQTGYVTDAVSGGSFVVGIVGGNWTGAISYFVMDAANFGQFVGVIFNNNYASAGGVTDVWDNFTMKLEDIPVKTLVNPAQYITSVMWFPFAVPGGGTTSNIRFAWWWSGVGALNAGTRLKQFTYIVDYSSLFASGVPKYQYCAPYAEYSVRVPGFGIIPLPASSLIGMTSIKIRIDVDIYTGSAVCNVLENAALPTDRYIARANGTLGIPFAIGGDNPNYASMINSGVQAITGGIGAVATGDPGLAIGAAKSAIQTAADAFSTEVKTIGGHGSAADISGDIVFMCRHCDLSEEHIVEFGRPLCKIKTISTLTGFVQCADGNIQTSLTDAEKQQIKSYLETGFYYE